jgi:hypothetical protein
MGPLEAKVHARNEATDKLNELTAIIAMGGLAALGLFAVIAAQTIPGKADSGASGGNASSTGSSAVASTSTPTQSTRHHHFDSGSISSASGPPLVVSGGSH